MLGKKFVWAKHQPSTNSRINNDGCPVPESAGAISETSPSAYPRLRSQVPGYARSGRTAVSEAVFERLNESILRKEELLQRLQRENKLLRGLRRLDLIKKYGPSAETLSDEQLELLELEPGVSCSEIEAESQRTQPDFADSRGTSIVSRSKSTQAPKKSSLRSPIWPVGRRP